MIKLLLERIYTCPTYTIGHFYVNGKYICDTIEDTDRGLDQSMPYRDVIKIKVYGKTAIPTGEYPVVMSFQSPKFSKKEYYKKLCNGHLPRLINVKGFSGVLIHVGNTANDSAGCILVGYNKVKGKVIDSRVAFEKLMNTWLIPVIKTEEEVKLTIKRKYKV